MLKRTIGHMVHMFMSHSMQYASCKKTVGSHIAVALKPRYGSNAADTALTLKSVHSSKLLQLQAVCLLMAACLNMVIVWLKSVFCARIGARFPNYAPITPCNTPS